MSKWKEVALGDIASFNYGKVPKKERLNKPTNKYFVYSGYGITGTYDEYMYEEEKLIVIARGVGGTGDVKLAPKYTYITNLAIIFHLDQTRIHKQFLYYLLSILNLRTLDTGAAQSQITIANLKKFKINIPTITNQKKIASILFPYDAIINNNKKKISILKRTMEQIYREWFIRMRFPNHSSTSFRKGIPHNWEVYFVKDIIDRLPTRRRYKQSELFKKGKVIVIDQSEKSHLGFHNDEPSYHATIDDPILIFGDHTCKMEMITEDFSLAENVIAFRSARDYPMLFLLYMLKRLTKTKEYKRHWATFVNHKVLLPPRNLQWKFHDQTIDLFKQIKKLQQMNQQLMKQRDLLLPRLMNNTIDVRNVQLQS